MIVLAFNVTGTDLRRTDINKIVAVSRNNVEAKFSFNSDWDNISPKVVQFYKDNKYYDVSLANNACIVPWEVLTSAGTLSITVTGGNLITTTTVDINVYGSGLSSTGLAPTKASPGVYTEIVKLAEKIETDYNGMKSTMDTYEETVNTAMTDISEFVANAHESKIEAEESAESAANSLEDLKNTVVNIENEVEGYTATATDCSDKKVANVVVYGRSTQADVPTMDSPQSITDITGNVEIKVYDENLHNVQTVTCTLNEPLRSVPCTNINKANITIDGKGCIADEICVYNGEVGVLKMVDNIRLTSSGFSEFSSTAIDMTGKKIFQKGLGTSYMNAPTTSGLCTHFKVRSNKYTVGDVYFPDRRIMVTVDDSYTLDTFKEFLDSNEVYIQLPLAEPIFTAFDENTQTTLKCLTTYKGVTNVNNSVGAYTKLKYIADTKLYIDNKIEEVAKAIVATESEV